MTTKKIPGADNFDSEREIAAAFLARDNELDKEEGDDKLIALGAAVKIQSLKDRAATRAEEKDQQSQIRNRAKDFLGTDAPTPVEPPAPSADPTPAPPAPAPPVEPPAPPTAPEPVAAPAATGTVALGLPAPTEPPQRRSTRLTIVTFFHGLGWGRVAWTLAVIFGSIALLWLLLGYDGFFPSRPEALRVIGAIVITIFFFFIGGTIGSAIDRNRDRAVVVTTHEEVPPAIPVPPVAS